MGIMQRGHSKSKQEMAARQRRLGRAKSWGKSVDIQEALCSYRIRCLLKLQALSVICNRPSVTELAGMRLQWERSIRLQVVYGKFIDWLGALVAKSTAVQRRMLCYCVYRSVRFSLVAGFGGHQSTEW